MEEDELVKYIDLTLLSPTAVEDDFEKLFSDALEYGFKSVCVPPCYVKQAIKRLEGSPVGVGTVCSFPFGNSTLTEKVHVAWEAVKLGITDFDMVMNLSAFKSGNFDYVVEDIKNVTKALKDIEVKAIIECCYLTDIEKEKAVELLILAGAGFVKTSTGVATGGATVQDVKLLKKLSGDRLKVKASGGIKTLDFALELIDAGADRLGVSSGVEIIKSLRKVKGKVGS